MSNGITALGAYNGELYAGGFFTIAGGVSTNHIAKWNGTSWSPLGSGMDSHVTSLAAYNGELYAGGFFSTAGGSPADFIARWNGTNWFAVGGGMGTWDSDVNALAVYKSELYAAGYFITAGDIPASDIAKWDGTNWSDVGNIRCDEGLFSLAVYNEELYVGGGGIIGTGGISANGIAKWDGTSWSAVGSGMNERVFALAVYNGELYAGGYFTTAGGIPVNKIAKWDGSSWTPVSSGITGGMYNIGVFALTVYNGELYAAGHFTTAGGISVNHIAKWNGTSWSPVGSGLNKDVYALAVYNGELYAGGFFTTAGGISANYIAKWSNCNALSAPGIISGSASVCAGSIQTYSVSPVSGATSYTWILPAGWSGTSTTNSINVSVGANSGSISVTANNSCGSSPPQSLAVSVISNPAQPGSIIGSSSVCKGISQTYSVNGVGGATSYTWILPTDWTGTSTTNSITAIVGLNSGNISVSANNSCDANSPAQILAVTVNSTPAQPGSIKGDTIVNVGQTFNYSISSVSNATGYNWLLSGGGNIISGQNTTSISVNWLMSGNYTLSVNANSSCGTSSNQTLNVLVIDPDNPFQIKVTPNPSPGDFYLTVKGAIDKEMHIEIFNLPGQKIYSYHQRVGANDYSMLLKLEKVASGIYLVKIIIDEKIYIRKILKIS